MFCVIIDSLCFSIDTKKLIQKFSTKNCSKFFFYRIPSDMIWRLLKQAHQTNRGKPLLLTISVLGLFYMYDRRDKRF